MLKKTFLLVVFVVTGAVVLGGSVWATEAQAVASDGGSFFLQTSLLTRHYQNEPEFNNRQELIGLEYQNGSKLAGLAHFQNSFRQPCWYLYVGELHDIWNLAPNIRVYGKVTAGIIHGYHAEDGKYEKLLNRLGTFPVVVPSIGVKGKRIAVDVIFFAAAGFLITAGINF